MMTFLQYAVFGFAEANQKATAHMKFVMDMLTAPPN